MNLKARAARGNQAFRFGKFGGTYGYNDPWGGLWRMLAGSTFDYRREAGILWENSIVLIGVRWVMRNFGRARVMVERPTGKILQDGEEEYAAVPRHPFTELWNKPNPYYSKSTLLKGLLLSHMVDGNAHVFINRSRAQIPVELYYVPYWQVSPRWNADGARSFPSSTGYLDHWEYRMDGKIDKWKPEDVFLWRDGIDPQNARRGLSPLTAVLREVCADNSLSVVSASILRNHNIPGLMVSAKPVKQDDGSVGSSFSSLTPEQEEKMRAMARQKWTGDRVGEMMVVPAPVDVNRLSLSPSEMDFSGLSKRAEARILAMWGLPLSVVGVLAGLEQTKVGATMKAQIELAWDQCLIPMQDEFAEELTFWGRRDFASDFQDGERVVLNRSKVTALQADQDELHERVRSDWEKDLIQRGEGRALLGMEEGKNDKVYYSQVAGRTPTGSQIEPVPLTEGGDDSPEGDDQPEDQEENQQ